MMSERPALVQESSLESIESWCNRPYIGDALRGQILKANVLLVPIEGFRERTDPMFPQGTEDLLQFLRESPNEDIKADICIEDEDYRELALHFDLLVLAGAVVTLVVAPIVADLISEYIKRRLGSREPETIVRSELIVYDETTGRSVRLSYEGPASAYRDTMGNAIHGMCISPSLGLPPPEHLETESGTTQPIGGHED